MDWVLAFMRAFVEYADHEQLEGSFDFLEDLMRRFVEMSGASDKTIRLECCTLLATFMHSFKEGVELSELFISELQDAMLLRTKDKIPQIRAKAALALALLQDPGEVCNVLSLKALYSDQMCEQNKVICLHFHEPVGILYLSGRGLFRGPHFPDIPGAAGGR